MTDPPASWSAPGGDPTPPAPAGQPAAPQYGQPPAPQYGQPLSPWPGVPQRAEPGVIPIRPLALGEILDGAIKVIRRYPRPTLGLSAAIALVVTALNVLAALLIGGSSRESAESGELDPAQVAAEVGAAGPAQLLAFLAGLVLTGAIVTVVGRAVQGKPAPWHEVWPTVRPRLWSLLGLALLTGLIVIAPLLLAGVAAATLLLAGGPTAPAVVVAVLLLLLATPVTVYLYTRLALGPAVLVLEKADVRTSLRRSGVLVRDAWWRTFGVLVLTAVIAGVISSILVVPVLIVSELFLGGGSTGALVLQQVGAGLASVLLAPFSAGVRALLYVDRRMRAEGLDVALQAALHDGG